MAEQRPAAPSPRRQGHERVDAAPCITGIGLVTALGHTAAQTWDALLAGRAIDDHAKVGIEFPPGLPRVSQLALRAAREALAGKDRPLAETALVVGTSKGPVEWWLGPPSTLSDVKPPIWEGLSQVATDLARQLLVEGPRITVSAACASGLLALIRGAMLIESRQTRRALVVAAEASVHPLFVGSFRRLGVLPAQGVGCRPFDAARDGFLMSEAAAAVLLERDVRGPGVLIERYGLGADATHLTGIDPDGESLRYLLRTATAGKGVDVVHAHGTGTAVNDPVELDAIDSCIRIPDPPPSVYSHKGALGHSLGAAGLVSVVINCMMHRHGMVPPNVHTTQPIASSRVRIRRDAHRRTVRRSVALAAGFGGPLAVVVLKSD